MRKIILVTLLFLIAMYGCIWMFNHTIAWIGIFLGIILLFGYVCSIKHLADKWLDEVEKQP